MPGGGASGYSFVIGDYIWCFWIFLCDWRLHIQRVSALVISNTITSQHKQNI